MLNVIINDFNYTLGWMIDRDPIIEVLCERFVILMKKEYGYGKHRVLIPKNSYVIY